MNQHQEIQHNTIKFPKKSRLKGTCADCGAPIPAAKRYCPECKLKRKEEKDGIRSWTTPTGKRVKRKVADSHVSENVVFEVSGSKFSANSPSGPFLDTLIGICCRRPSYIHVDDAARYASLIDDFMNFPYSPHPWESDSPTTTVQDIPLDRIGPALRDWVMSFFDEQYHPLMATYALDTAGFIIAHGDGKWMYSSASMPALLSPMIERYFFSDGIFGSTFKRNFTQRIDSRDVFLAEVPEGGAVVRFDQTLFGPGTRFLFRMVRCHLSDGWGDYVYLQTKEEDAPEYNINEVMLPGALWFDSSNSPAASFEDVYHKTGKRIDIPLQWITHAICNEDGKDVLLPLPQWE